MPRVLFILKQRKSSGSESASIPSGLNNSARFVSWMLEYYNIQSSVVEVIDNNEIDRVVTEYKPSHVIIEALWVVPEKFDILQRLHPNVKWIVRLHSNTPFLAGEGIAFEWLPEYLKRGISVAANHELMFEDLGVLYPEAFENGKLLLLPNYYPIDRRIPFWSRFRKDTELHIGCFGAIRPLKNHLTQAIASISYANTLNKTLYFHVNSSRVERGENQLKNIRSLFRNSRHNLVEHEWMPHHEFRELLSGMDACMQVSFSETFNIVTADAVSVGTPVVVSSEIEWVSDSFKADPNDSKDIEFKLHKALTCPTGAWRNQRGLKKYNRKSEDFWLDYFI